MSTKIPESSINYINNFEYTNIFNTTNSSDIKNTPVVKNEYEAYFNSLLAYNNSDKNKLFVEKLFGSKDAQKYSHISLQEKKLKFHEFYLNDFTLIGSKINYRNDFSKILNCYLTNSSLLEKQDFKDREEFFRQKIMEVDYEYYQASRVSKDCQKEANKMSLCDQMIQNLLSSNIKDRENDDGVSFYEMKDKINTNVSCNLKYEINPIKSSDSYYNIDNKGTISKKDKENEIAIKIKDKPIEAIDTEKIKKAELTEKIITENVVKAEKKQSPLKTNNNEINNNKKNISNGNELANIIDMNRYRNFSHLTLENIKKVPLVLRRKKNKHRNMNNNHLMLERVISPTGNEKYNLRYGSPTKISAVCNVSNNISKKEVTKSQDNHKIALDIIKKLKDINPESKSSFSLHIEKDKSTKYMKISVIDKTSRSPKISNDRELEIILKDIKNKQTLIKKTSEKKEIKPKKRRTIKIENYLLKTILENMSTEISNPNTIFQFNKGEEFEDIFYEFLDLNFNVISLMFNNMNTQYMKIISTIFSNKKQDEKQDSSITIPNNMNIKKVNFHQISLIIFFIGCYIQDIIKDQKEQIYNTEANKSIKYGFEDINTLEYDFNKDRYQYIENNVVFDYITQISNDDISDLLNDIHNSFMLISTLTKEIVQGYKPLFNLYCQKYKNLQLSDFEDSFNNLYFEFLLEDNFVKCLFFNIQTRRVINSQVYDYFLKLQRRMTNCCEISSKNLKFFVNLDTDCRYIKNMSLSFLIIPLRYSNEASEEETEEKDILDDLSFEKKQSNNICNAKKKGKNKKKKNKKVKQQFEIESEEIESFKKHIENSTIHKTLIYKISPNFSSDFIFNSENDTIMIK